MFIAGVGRVSCIPEGLEGDVRSTTLHYRH